MIFTVWLGAALSIFDSTPRTPPPSAVPDRNPVLLIHGIADSERNMQWLARYLRGAGWEVHTMNLKPNWGQAGLEPLAAQIDTYARGQFGARKFDLVGFSMGGLVSRYYVQRLGGWERVEHFVTLSAPHQGTVMAHLIPNLGCRQMRPGSPFLRDLARDTSQLDRVKFTSLYTPFDVVIVPARNSTMPQAQNVRVPVAMHPLMVLDARCKRAVAEALSR
jgi:triacylglycerol lipase